MKYRFLRRNEIIRKGDQYKAGGRFWASSDQVGDRVSMGAQRQYRRPIKKVVAKPTYNTQMAAALWKELKRRQSNGLVPLRVDWVAVTQKRLNAAVAALCHR